MDYQSEYRQAKNLLLNEDYNLCAMLCGRILESILKTVLYELSSHPEVYKLPKKTMDVLGNDYQANSRLTLGKVVRLIKRIGALKRFSGPNKLNVRDLYYIELDKMVLIRNKASHENQDDSIYSAGADAFIIYGYLVKLWGILGHLPMFDAQPAPVTVSPLERKRAPRKIVIEPERITKRKVRIAPQESQPKQNYVTDFPELIEVCRNKSSGKIFVLLNDAKAGESNFILPDGKIKNLPTRLFIEPEEINREALTTEQINTLNKYRQEEGAGETVNLGVRSDREDEPRYIGKYRNMMNNPNSVPSIMLYIIKKNGPLSWKSVKKSLISEYGYKESGSFGASLRVLTLDGYVRVEGKGDEKTLYAINRN